MRNDMEKKNYVRRCGDADTADASAARNVILLGERGEWFFYTYFYFNPMKNLPP